MFPERLRQRLRNAWGQTPAAPADEFNQILRRVRMTSDEAKASPLLIVSFALSLLLCLAVTFFLKPQSASEGGNSDQSLSSSFEATSPYDDSLSSLASLTEP